MKQMNAIGVVVHIFDEKGLAIAVFDHEQSAVFPLELAGESLEVGDFVELSLERKKRKDGQMGWFTHAANRTDTQPAEEVYRVVDGTIHIPRNQAFGFVDGVFVPPTLVKDLDLNDDDAVTIGAALNFNKKRNEWGFAALWAERA